jgi:CheY-like chemotaxis protein
MSITVWNQSLWSALLKEYFTHATVPSETKGVLIVNTTHQKRILIAGDTYRWRDQVKTALPQQGVDISFATDCVDAFQASVEEGKQPDIYILANKMPDQDDGLKILRELREDGCVEPVIICSTHVSEEASAEISRLDGIHINWHPEEVTDEISAVIDLLLVA